MEVDFVNDKNSSLFFDVARFHYGLRAAILSTREPR
jgi:hypothetical protein